MKRYHWFGFLPFYLLAIIVFIGIAHLSSGAVTAVKQNTPIPRKYRFVIDAGHGGIDGGATSCTGVLESTINLEIAVKLNDLMQFLGYDTVMIRTTDTSIHTKGDTIASQKVSDLKERARIVNETENAVLISIHQNTFSDSRYGGAQVFYAAEGESRQLAEKLQTTFTQTVNPGSNRKCKTAKGIYLMEHIYRTGLLIECGFLSNPQEEAKLRSPEYQNKLCCVIAATVGTYLSNT